MSNHKPTPRKRIGPAVLTALGAAMASQAAGAATLGNVQPIQIVINAASSGGLGFSSASAPGALSQAEQSGYGQAFGTSVGSGHANGAASYGTLGVSLNLNLGSGINHGSGVNLGGLGLAFKGHDGTYGTLGGGATGGFASTTNIGPAASGTAVAVSGAYGIGVYSPALQDGGNLVPRVAVGNTTGTGTTSPSLTQVSFVSDPLGFGPSAALGFGAEAGYGAGNSVVGTGEVGGGTSTTAGGYGTINGAQFSGVNVASVSSIGGGALGQAGNLSSGWSALGYGATGGTYSTSASGAGSHAGAGSVSQASGLGVVSTQLNAGGTFVYEVHAGGV